VVRAGVKANRDKRAGNLKNPPFGGGALGRIFKPARDGGVETRQYNRTKGPHFPCERRYPALKAKLDPQIKT
jgi:hypothetical protein